MTTNTTYANEFVLAVRVGRVLGKLIFIGMHEIAIIFKQPKKSCNCNYNKQNPRIFYGKDKVAKVTEIANKIMQVIKR